MWWELRDAKDWFRSYPGELPYVPVEGDCVKGSSCNADKPSTLISLVSLGIHDNCLGQMPPFRGRAWDGKEEKNKAWPALPYPGLQ